MDSTTSTPRGRRCMLLGLALTLFGLALTLYLAACGNDFTEEFAKARKTFENGDPLGARKMAQELVEKTPADAEEARAFADFLIILGDASAALDILERFAADGSPATSDVRITAWLALGETRKAQRELGRRYSKKTDTARTAQLKGRLFFAQGKLHEAKSALLQAQARDEKNPLTWALLGLVMVKLGEREDAEQLLWEAHRRFPKACEVRVALAEIILPGRENLKETLEAVAKLLGYVAEHRPLDLRSRARLGTVLNRLGRHVEAIAVLKRLTNEEPTAAGPWSDLGVAHAKLGEFEEASKAFQNAIAIDPENVPMLLNLGNCFLEMAFRAEDRGPLLDKAERTFLRAIEVGGRTPQTLVGLARVAVKRDPRDDPQAEKAIDLYRKALELDPNCFEAHLNLALLYYDIWIPFEKTKTEGHWRAMEQFEKAAKIVPPERWKIGARNAYEDLKTR